MTIVPSGLWVSALLVSADATIALLLVHFVLHWKWIVNAAGKLGRAPRAVRDSSIPSPRSAWRPAGWPPCPHPPTP